MTRIPSFATVMALTLTLVLGGCAPQGPRYVDAGADYDVAAITALLGSIDTGELAEKPVAQAPRLRRESLTDLRTRGGDAAAAADLITDTFAGANRGVPVYIETATYSGKPAVVVVEAIGRKGGNLVDARIWVLSEDGDVLYSGLR